MVTHCMERIAVVLLLKGIIVTVLQIFIFDKTFDAPIADSHCSWLTCHVRDRNLRNFSSVGVCNVSKSLNVCQKLKVCQSSANMALYQSVEAGTEIVQFEFLKTRFCIPHRFGVISISDVSIAEFILKDL